MKTDDQYLVAVVKIDYPKVAKALELYWSHKEFPRYMQSLLNDETGKRQGFNPTAITALMHLQASHDEQFPEYTPDADAWASSLFL